MDAMSRRSASCTTEGPATRQGSPTNGCRRPRIAASSRTLAKARASTRATTERSLPKAHARLRDGTRIIYTSDHGEAIGERGMWMKGTMYEGVAGVPLIVAGPGIPRGRTSTSFASLVDAFPSVLECTGVPAGPADADLPGRSLWRLAEHDDRGRTIFAEYHASFAPSAIFLIREGDLKFVYYVDDEPQLFDLLRDPDELDDRAADPSYAAARASCEAKLRAIVDPEVVDRAAKADQARRIAERGGAKTILAEGVRIPYTPVPRSFNPAG
jgi:choline-sulfatase